MFGARIIRVIDGGDRRGGVPQPETGGVNAHFLGDKAAKFFPQSMNRLLGRDAFRAKPTDQILEDIFSAIMVPAGGLAGLAVGLDHENSGRVFFRALEEGREFDLQDEITLRTFRFELNEFSRLNAEDAALKIKLAPGQLVDFVATQTQMER